MCVCVRVHGRRCVLVEVCSIGADALEPFGECVCVYGGHNAEAFRCVSSDSDHSDSAHLRTIQSDTNYATVTASAACAL